MDDKAPVWHREVVTPAVERILRNLAAPKLLNGFYLAGGTALALQFGHRRSADLDFFRNDSVDADWLIQSLQDFLGFVVRAKEAGTLHVDIEGIKISFLEYRYPLLFPLLRFEDADVAEPRDIAGMKVSAIAGRGTRRDFIDLYLLAKQYGMDQVVAWFDAKFAKANYNRLHVLKSLTYFEDAEREPMPHMLIPLTWDEVRTFFIREVPRLI